MLDPPAMFCKEVPCYIPYYAVSTKRNYRICFNAFSYQAFTWLSFELAPTKLYIRSRVATVPGKPGNPRKTGFFKILPGKP